MTNGVLRRVAEPGYVMEFVPKGSDLTLVRDKKRVDQFLCELLRTESPVLTNPVSKAMEYATMGAAQRYRPILALRVARMLGAETDSVLRAAAAVELIHSASLIIDDLPCMDDEAMRRGRSAVHRQYGEATAILAAFSMVALSARIVMETAIGESECMRLRRFQLALLRTLDVSSLVGGQSLDLLLAGDEREAMRAEMNDLKTVPLFQLAVEAGCVSYPEPIPANLEQFGRIFGVAFQLTDDFLDGEFSDRSILDHTYEHCRACLQPFGEHANPLLHLLETLEERTAAA